MTENEFIDIFNSCFHLRDTNPAIAKTLENLKLLAQLEPSNSIKPMNMLLEKLEYLDNQVQQLNTQVSYLNQCISRPNDSVTLTGFVRNEANNVLQNINYNPAYYTNLTAFIDARIQHHNVTGDFTGSTALNNYIDDVVEWTQQTCL
jgi:hypothetical protein